MHARPFRTRLFVVSFLSFARFLSLALCSLAVATSACSVDEPVADGDANGASSEQKVTVAGDSIAFGLGSELRGAVPDDVDVKVIAEGGTGLARPDSFDWPDRLAQLADDFPPTTLVFSVGSNDRQDIADSDGTVIVPLADTDAWDAEYSARLAAAFDAFEGTGTNVVWVGQVRTRDPKVAEYNRHIHELAKEQAATRPWVKVADLSALLGFGESRATGCLIEDGLHLSPKCYQRADEALLPQLGVS